MEHDTENLDTELHENYANWPMLHELGFIPRNAYSKKRILYGKYTALDLILIVDIPLVLEHDIMAFHWDSVKNTGKIASTQVIDGSACVKYLTVLQCNSVMDAAEKRGTI